MEPLGSGTRWKTIDKRLTRPQSGSGIDVGLGVPFDFHLDHGWWHELLLTGWSLVRIRPGEPSKVKYLGYLSNKTKDAKIHSGQHSGQHSPNFAKGQCPAFIVSPKIARAAHAKQLSDEAEYAKLVKDNVSAAPIHSGLDGGMNEVFRTRFPGVIIPLAMVLPPESGLELPQLPPIPWTSNDGSLADRFFGAALGSN